MISSSSFSQPIVTPEALVVGQRVHVESHEMMLKRSNKLWLASEGAL
jgi:hypothetical protein